MRKIVSVIILFVATFSSCTNTVNQNNEKETAQIKNLASTPPVGWNSWNCFGIEATETQVKAVVDYMTENHWPDADMLPLGKLRINRVGKWEASLFNAT